MPTVFTEGMHPGEFLVSEANGRLSRDVVTLAQTSITYQSGSVLAWATDISKWVHYAESGTHGTDTAGAINYARVDASGGDKQATVIARLAEVNGAQLSFLPGTTTNGKAAAAVDLIAAPHLIAVR
ncbi:head decoration protein [Nitrospirillum iridis]|uniref:Head decoration protein n=1 Tax=Nitrospirillum iridis TaxID=765888 RepID=A0A7X0AWK3_9PROT|nr:head decoration protein [Nitrospirillum iridis]MBB6251423.1 hypothetical protein [Nitrospirillum iridis]